MHQLFVRWTSCKPRGSLKPRCPVHQMVNNHKNLWPDNDDNFTNTKGVHYYVKRRKKKLKIRSFSREIQS